MTQLLGARRLISPGNVILDKLSRSEGEVAFSLAGIAWLRKERADRS
jgi:hypothetical protein